MKRIFFCCLSFIISISTFCQSTYSYKLYSTVVKNGAIIFKLEYGVNSSGYNGYVKWRFTNYSNFTLYDININNKTYTLSNGKIVGGPGEQIASIIEPGNFASPANDAVNGAEYSGSYSSKNDNPVVNVSVKDPEITFKTDKNGNRISWKLTETVNTGISKATTNSSYNTNSGTTGSASKTTSTGKVNNSTSQSGNDDFWNSSSTTKSNTSSNQTNTSNTNKTSSVSSTSTTQKSGTSTSNQNAEAQRLQQQQEAEMKRANELAAQKQQALQEQRRKEEEEKRRNQERYQAEIYRLEQEHSELLQKRDQAVNELTNFIGSTIALNQANKAEFEEKKREEELIARQRRMQAEEEKRQTEEYERIEAERIRNLGIYYENSISQYSKPSSYSNGVLSEVYYFYVIRTGQEELKLTNPFPVRKLSDNTWPFKSDIDNKLKSSEGYSDAKLVGYYSSKDEALKKRGEYINTLQNKGFLLSNMNFTYKDYNGPANQPNPAKPKTTTSGDFWKK